MSAQLGEIVRNASDQIACNEKKGRVHSDLGCDWHGANSLHSRRPEHSPAPSLLLPAFLGPPPFSAYSRHLPSSFLHSFPLCHCSSSLLPFFDRFVCFAAPFLFIRFITFHSFLFLASFLCCCCGRGRGKRGHTIASHPFSSSVRFRIFLSCIFQSLLFPLLLPLRWTSCFLFASHMPSLRRP